MHEAVASPLRPWESFYVIVGSSAGALTGLQFVVMTLIGEAGTRDRKNTIAAYGSPNVVHFCAALLAAAILSAPWSGLAYVGLSLSAVGVMGVVYSVVVLRRARRQQGYRPVLEDWVWHTILPLLAYSALVVTGATLEWGSTNALFVVGAAVLLLVFVGIHNAWDTVTYVMTQQGATEPAMEVGSPGGGDVPASMATPDPGPGSSSAPEAARTPGPEPTVR